MKCDLAVCAPSTCTCPPGTGAWACSKDCTAGVCVGTKDCSAISDALAQALPPTGGCTAVLRLKFSTLQVVSHTFVCGPIGPPNEAAVRATADADTTYGSGDLYTGPTPSDAWVFVERNHDVGGVAAVDATTGLTLFGAGIIWQGLGKVTYPPSWDTQNIESTCSGPVLPNRRGIDLVVSGGVALSDAETAMVAGATARTAVPAVLAKSRTLRQSLVLRYGPHLGITGEPGGFANALAEYVVIINAD